MANEFKAEVFQNQFVPRGVGEVHAIMTVTAADAAGTPGGPRLFGILCDSSGSMEGGKIVAARGAMSRLVSMLPEDCSFFIVAGCEKAMLVYPVARATQENKVRAMAYINKIRADGGTAISTWLAAALAQFRSFPPGFRQAVLLTDG